MKIHWRQTGDPWHDWGLCELYDLLQSCEWPDGKEAQISAPDAAGFDFEAGISPQEFGATIQAQMAASDRWNELYPRFQEGKKIPRCAPSIVNGRRVAGEKCDPKVTKEEWEAHGCVGNLPSNARNKAQRISNVPLTPAALDTLLEPAGGKGSFGIAATLAVMPGETGDVSQGANPLVAKHHSNGKTRGPSAGNSARVESAQFLLPCFLASVSANKPFVKDPNGDCTVYLPENVPFDRALRLWTNLKTVALVHPDAPNGTMYRNLPLNGDGEDAQVLVLLDSLQSRLGPVRAAEDLDEEDVRELNNWLAINYSSGTNVNIGVIHRIEVPGSVFPLLQPIAPPAHWTKETLPVSFVRDCLSGVRLENTPIQSHIAAALFQQQATACWHDLAECAFTLYKRSSDATKSNRKSANLLSHFFAYFATKLHIMTDEQLTACRKIGELAGNAFCRDVTLLSRLHNSAKPSDLRENLELFAFRLMKASNGDEKNNLWHISAEQFRTVLELASTDDWAAAAQTISLFASLSAFNKNLGQAATKS